MTATNININRDYENDILYVMKEGVDRKTTINIGATADVLLRLDPEEHKLVGLTIEDFSEIFPDLKDQTDYILMEHFDNLIELLNASHKAMSRV